MMFVLDIVFRNYYIQDCSLTTAFDFETGEQTSGRAHTHMINK